MKMKMEKKRSVKLVEWVVQLRLGFDGHKYCSNINWLKV